MLNKPSIKLASADSTGFEARHVSQHFLHRKSHGKPIFAKFHPKLSIICDCKNHLILSLLTSKGPFPDAPSLVPLLAKLPPWINVDKLLGDAGYDSEENHRISREEFGIRSFFPPLIGRPLNGIPKGKYRRLMKKLFIHKDNIHFGQRWQVETVFSMIKRVLGTATRARKHSSRMRELALIALTYNLAVVRACYLFYGAARSPVLKRMRFGLMERSSVSN